MEKSRKRLYRSKVKCSKCAKEVDGDYKSEHSKRAHENDPQVKFHPVIDAKQRKLSFGVLTSTNTSEKREQTETASSAAESTDVQDIHVDIEDKQDDIQVLAPAVPDVETPACPAREAQKIEAPVLETEECSEEKSAVSDTEILDGPNQPLLSEYHRKNFLMKREQETSTQTSSRNTPGPASTSQQS